MFGRDGIFYTHPRYRNRDQKKGKEIYFYSLYYRMDATDIWV